MAKGRRRQKTREAATAPRTSARMERAWRLFDEGDKLLARREAKAILGDSSSGPDAEEARELLERTQIPRVALIAAGAAAALVLLLILLAIART
jgi:hypothetical protein